MKILIVKLSSIGDVIHTLPVLPAIRQALPEAEISWIVEKGAAEILRGNPLLARLVEIDTRGLRRRHSLRDALPALTRDLRALRRERFDVALDFQGLLKSATIAKIIRAKRRFGFSRDSLREPASRFLLTDQVDVAGEISIVRKNLALAGKALKISVPADDFEFPIFSQLEHRAEADRIIGQTNGNFAILNPAAGWVTKMWDAAKFGRLADRLWETHGLTSVVTTAPNERKLAAAVIEASKSGKAIAATPTLKGFYELARRARIYIGNDTGPTFLAVAAQTPVVGIFGPTMWRRNGSPRAADIGVERDDIGCRANCHRRTCANWICLDISVETVLRAVEKRLSIERVSEVTIG